MNSLLHIIIASLAGYGLFELFLMAVHANKERRFFVILQIASGFCLCIWIILDRDVGSYQLILALLFIACDRLQTRLSSKAR